MAVVKAAASEHAIAVDDVDDAAGLGFRRRLFHHLLEDPGMIGTALDLQTHKGIGNGIHPHMIPSDSLAPAAKRPMMTEWSPLR